MPRRSQYPQSHDLRPVYSGAPKNEPDYASLNSSGFEPYSALSDLSLSPTTHASADKHTSFDHYPPQPGYAQNNLDYNHSYLEHYDAVDNPGFPSGTHAQQFDAYWHSHAAAPEEHTPLPSPPLLSANSLNLPPLLPLRQDHSQQFLSSHHDAYSFAPPPNVPYAESAASAASSNLSPQEDEGLPKGPMDEEKRRRNLAASARFRQKKKIREQQLEQQTKELCDRAGELEDRISELEKENNFLKALLTEKDADMTSEQKKKFHDFALLVEQGEL